MLDNPLIEGATEPVDAREDATGSTTPPEPSAAFPTSPDSLTTGLSASGRGASDWDDVFPAQPARPTASPDTFRPAASPNESFDPYSLAEDARDTELAEAKEQLFRYRLRELAPGIENDEALVIAATKTLERAGTPLTPEALAAEYRRLDAEQHAKYEARAARRTRTSGTYAGPSGTYSGVRRARPSAPKDEPKTLIDIIRQDRRRRGLSFY